MSYIIENIDAYGKKLPIPSYDDDYYVVGEDSESFGTYAQEQIDNFSQNGISLDQVIRWDYLNTSFGEELDMDIGTFYEEIKNNRPAIRAKKRRKFEEWIREKGYWKGEHSLQKEKNILDPLIEELNHWCDQLIDVIDQLRNVTDLKTAKVRDLGELSGKYLQIGTFVRDSNGVLIEDIPFDEMT